MALASAGKAVAQASSTQVEEPAPAVVTGTNPEPDYIGIILAILGLA